MGSNSRPWSVMGTCQNNSKDSARGHGQSDFLNLFCFPFSHPYGGGFLAFLLVIFSLCSPSRLPIIQGGTFAFLTPTLAMLSLPKWKCPAWTQNATLVNASSPDFIEVWQTRMREVYYIFGGTCSVSGLLPFRKVPDHGRAITAGELSIPNEP